MSALASCGGGCGCGVNAARPPAAPAHRNVPTVNGVPLHDPGLKPDEAQLRELAWAELLRQEAVRRGLLPAQAGTKPQVLAAADRRAIETMLEAVVEVPQPTEEECRRYYEARAEHYAQGRMVNLRHILFAVTAGVDVNALAVRAESALLELSRPGVNPGRFAELARELSNCPSGANGGDLGWIGPQDCAEELAKELFHPQNSLPGTGLRPRLVHTRYGFHIVEVLGRKQGRRLPFEDVRGRIAVQLTQSTRARALHQYVKVLASQATVEGLALEMSDSPLVQ